MSAVEPVDVITAYGTFTPPPLTCNPECYWVDDNGWVVVHDPECEEK
jgi:hypothetical protein